MRSPGPIKDLIFYAHTNGWMDRRADGQGYIDLLVGVPRLHLPVTHILISPSCPVLPFSKGFRV